MLTVRDEFSPHFSPFGKDAEARLLMLRIRKGIGPSSIIALIRIKRSVLKNL
jgi:hypothetical protein